MAELEDGTNPTTGALEADDRIEALEREVKELRAALREHVVAITNLTIGGSEFFGKRIGEIYTADLPFCTSHIRDRMGYRVDAVREKALREAAEADKARLSEALAGLCDWIENEVGAELPFDARSALSDEVTR